MPPLRKSIQHLRKTIVLQKVLGLFMSTMKSRRMYGKEMALKVRLIAWHAIKMQQRVVLMKTTYGYPQNENNRTKTIRISMGFSRQSISLALSNLFCGRLAHCRE
jgi:hypothetical protein